MEAKHIKYRGLLFVFLMSLLTIGIYYLYWTYQTKEEINSLGGKIPTFILMFIPFVNIYFHYKYADSFVSVVEKKSNDTNSVAVTTLLLVFLPIVGILIVQNSLNKISNCKTC